METLIVSRTRFGKLRCIGGIILEYNRSIRLVQKNGSYWPEDSPLQVGDVWDLEFGECQSHTLPFIENIIVLKGNQLRKNERVKDFIIRNKHNLGGISWEGSVTDLYEGKVKLQSSNSRAFIEVGDEPSMSTGFWTPSKDLILQADKKHYQYISPYKIFDIELNEIQEIAYVGEEIPLPVITAGTQCRVSLAQPIKPHPEFEGPDRLYVQLSGWYL